MDSVRVTALVESSSNATKTWGERLKRPRIFGFTLRSEIRLGRCHVWSRSQTGRYAWEQVHSLQLQAARDTIVGTRQTKHRPRYVLIKQSARNIVKQRHLVDLSASDCEVN